MTKMQNYIKAQTFGQDAAFVANVILTQHGLPAKKLAGLVKLLEDGHEVKCSQFSTDTLIVDGERISWADLH